MSRVLLVDDDEHLLALATKFLTKEEPFFEIVTVKSAKAAFQRLAAENFDAMVADYQMPSMNGLELLKTLRGESNTIPFIMFTGRGREEVAIQALNLGADHYLRKGGGPKSLYRELAHILNRIIAHKRIEKALLKSEREKTLILNSTSDAISYYDRDLKIVWANIAAARTVNRSPKELVGHHCYEVWRQRKKPCKGCPVVKAMESGEFHQRETITLDGRIWNHRAHPIVADNEVIGAVEVALDISEQKRAEEAYQTLVDQSLQGFVITQDERIVFANPATAKITGYSIEGLLALTPEGVGQIIHPEDRDLVIRYLRDRLAGKPAPERYEFRMIHKDDTIRWVEVFARVINYQGKPAIQRLVVDITQRKHAEEELQKFKAITDHAGYGVGLISPEGRLIYVNRAFAQMHGYSPEELNGEDFSVLHTEEQMIRVEELRTQLLQQGYYVAEEVWHKRKDGTVFPTLMNGTAIQDATGKPLFLAATTLEVSDWKKAERELQTSEELYRTTIDSLNDIVHVVDADLRFLLTNHAFKQFRKDTGFKTDVLGLTILEAIPSVPKTIIDEYHEVLATKKPKITEETIVASEKEFIAQVRKIPIFRDGHVTQIVTIIQDVTQLKLANES